MTSTRRALVAGALAAPAAPSVARAQDLRWRCVTSWTRDLPGPGVSARRLAARITELSRGELRIDLFAAGEIVPALATLDAVSNGTVEMAHTAALYWAGKTPAAPLFTTAPLGLTPQEHLAWLAEGGQTLWDDLYAPFNVKPFVAGNTGPSTGGWFRREVKSLEDVKGLRIRVTGLGANVYQALGATPLAIPIGDTYTSLERGTIDAVELLAPVNDAPLGFHKVAPHLALPGFNKPNGVSELLIGRARWEALPDRLKRAIEAACLAEHALATAEAEAANGAAVTRLVSEGATPFMLPADVIGAAAKAAGEALDAIAQSGPLAGRIVQSMRAAQERGRHWRRVQALSAYGMARG